MLTEFVHGLAADEVREHVFLGRGLRAYSGEYNRITILLRIRNARL